MHNFSKRKIIYNDKNTLKNKKCLKKIVKILKLLNH